jgi:hypothetical protein
MPSPFISDATKLSISGQMDSLHQTFLRPLTVYEEGVKVLIAATPHYNGIYGRTNTGGTSTEIQTVSHAISGRINYIKAAQEVLSDGAIQSSPEIGAMFGSVKLTLDASGFELLSKSKNCEFEGRKYNIESDGVPYGLFGPQHYIVYLRPTDS